jgi:hypothetical protein
VRRIRHETDRRVVLVEITDEGKALLDEIGDAAWTAGFDAFRTINSTELRRLTDSIRRIRDSAAEVGGVPADHLSYAEERLSIAPLAFEGNGQAAD